MKHKESIEKIISLVNQYLGIDCTKKTRQRDYCDAKSIVIKIMKDDFFIGWTMISKYFNERGTPIGTHASMINLYKRFDEVIKYNSLVKLCYYEVVGKMLTANDTEKLLDRIRIIKDLDKIIKIEKCLNSL
jgi:hypothetical protein